jgi:hypothetical protein
MSRRLRLSVGIEPDQIPAARCWQDYPMRKLIVFKCPSTGLQVQTPLPISAHEDQTNAYEAVTCLACTRLHFVNRTSGKVLGAAVQS